MRLSLPQTTNELAPEFLIGNTDFLDPDRATHAGIQELLPAFREKYGPNYQSNERYTCFEGGVWASG